MSDGVQFIVAVVIMLASTIAILLGIGDFHSRYVCSSFSKLSGLETKYQVLDTCYVKINGSFIRYSEYEKRAIAQNLKGE